MNKSMQYIIYMHRDKTQDTHGIIVVGVVIESSIFGFIYIANVFLFYFMYL